MTGFEIIHMGGAILLGYAVLIGIIVVAALLCSISDKLSEKIKMPNWVSVVGKIIFFVLMIIFSIVFAYGLGDLIIQRCI